MRIFRISVALLCLSLLCGSIPAAAKAARHSRSKAAATNKKKNTAAGHNRSSKSKSRHARNRKKSWKKRGQQTIAGDRVREIQAALISANYLQGEPSGVMDTATKAALVRMQAENGWQTKVVPDARALIKLGLGPAHENVLHPDTARAARPSATDITSQSVSQQ